MDFLSIFEVIVLSSLIGSVIVLMILIIKVIFRNKLNPTFHYYIWIILLIKLIIPFGPQTPLNISNIYQNFYTRSTTNENMQKTQIKFSKQLKNTDLEGSVAISTFEHSNNSGISNDINIPSKNKVNFEKVFCFIWISGVVLLIGILVAGHKKLREIINTSIKNINSTHKEILYNCMKAMNIQTDVELLYSQKIGSPSLCGFIKPKILIPVSVAINISNEEFKHIIMHELTHLKNKDIFINWVITLLSIIYWFNPILLYGFHKMRQDCEVSCDGQVISYLNKGENIQYGNTIIRVLELGRNSNRIVGTTSMVMNSGEIKRRIIMISEYKKINIKDILLGTILIVIIAGLGIAINTSKISSDKNLAKAATSQTETPAATSKSTVNNTSNKTVSTIMKKTPTDNTKSIGLVSSEIVIYNSHAGEDYPSGLKVTNIGTLINDKLVKEGLKSSFIMCNPPKEYIKSYQNTRNIITKNVKDYSNTILLDIHRDMTENNKSNTKTIQLILAKSNPHYEANKKFADLLLTEFGKSTEVKSSVFEYNKGISYFNQDLSNRSVLIEIGNNMSSDSDVEECVNVLVSALKNIQKGSSN
ncbi:M56 family metallopeptidase [Clostridium sp. ZS2-4]|uniref:M56 family metallopeptidase n=1 Tax=Clostridium sp. ZS2-4 TaxID=2987703 RepID=UPI00227A91F0|nr:M56 family metallopeptidase [Clostridium sp. ZS2-4]MCY6356253.1 stage II sporulation protein P [Clostridium sp. ZS2-4]